MHEQIINFFVINTKIPLQSSIISDTQIDPSNEQTIKELVFEWFLKKI